MRTSMKEEEIMLLLLDSPEFVASFFGAIKIGAVPIPTNTMLKANDFLYFLNDSGAKTLIVHYILLPEIEKIKDDLRYLKNIIVVENADSNYLSFNELITRESSDLYARNTLGLNEKDISFSAAKLFFAYGLVTASTFRSGSGHQQSCIRKNLIQRRIAEICSGKSCAL